MFNIKKNQVLRSELNIILIPIVLLLLIALLVVILALCIHRLHPQVRKLLSWIKTQLMFNSAIRYVLQCFFPVALGACTNMRSSFGKADEVVNFLLSFFTVMFLIIFTY